MDTRGNDQYNREDSTLLRLTRQYAIVLMLEVTTTDHFLTSFTSGTEYAVRESVIVRPACHPSPIGRLVSEKLPINK